jgi:hypothetical protein
LVALLSAAPATAGDWNVSSGDWDVPNNWLDGRVPTSSDSVFIANSGTAIIDSGVAAECWALRVHRGNVELGDGSLVVGDHEQLADSIGNPCVFRQTGGLHTVNGTFGMGGNGSRATYTQSGGRFEVRGVSVPALSIREGGLYDRQQGELSVPNELSLEYSTFRQTGGDVSVGTLFYDEDCRYELAGGHLASGSVLMATDLSGTSDAFVQTGGRHDVTGDLRMGVAGRATYQLDGGELAVGGTVSVLGYAFLGGSQMRIGAAAAQFGSVVVGSDTAANRSGVFSATSSAARIQINDALRLKSSAVVEAVPGSSIHMTGTGGVENDSTGPSSLLGLENLEFVFENGSGAFAPFEVAGKDVGANLAGFSNNYALHQLTLGGVDDGLVRLVNAFDNHGDGGREALYLDGLDIGLNSLLDLHGLLVYASESVTIDGTTYLAAGGYREFMPGCYTGLTDDLSGGKVILLPEPGTWMLLVLGALYIARGRR